MKSGIYRYIRLLALFVLLSVEPAICVDTASSRLSCYLFKDWMIFDLRRLEALQDYVSDDLNFNFCKYTKWPTDDLNSIHAASTYAYLYEDDIAFPLTSDAVVPQELNVTTVGQDSWLTFTQKSQTICPDAAGEYYSFSAEILCDNRYAGQGDAQIISVDFDRCDVKVKVAHDAGCPIRMQLQKFIHDYPWLFAIILIVAGPIIGLYGVRYFTWTIAGITAFVACFAALMICSILGWMDTTLMLSLCFVGSIAVGVGLGYLIKQTVWIAIAVLGLFGGFFLGMLLYSIIIAFVHSGQMWVMLSCAFLCAIAGGWISHRYGRAVVLVMTSLIGSYSFMRGLAYFVGGYPDEATLLIQLKDELSLEGYMTNMFWFYLVVFVTGWFGFMYYQRYKNQITDEELDNHYRRTELSQFDDEKNE